MTRESDSSDCFFVKLCKNNIFVRPSQTKRQSKSLMKSGFCCCSGGLRLFMKALFSSWWPKYASSSHRVQTWPIVRYSPKPQTSVVKNVHEISNLIHIFHDLGLGMPQTHHLLPSVSNIPLPNSFATHTHSLAKIKERLGDCRIKASDFDLYC